MFLSYLFLVVGDHDPTREAAAGGEEDRAVEEGGGPQGSAGRARGIFTGGTNFLLFCILF